MVGRFTEYSIIQEQRRGPNESQLILAAQKGDQRAFNHLVLMYQDVVFNLAYRMSGEIELAIDIAQNTFLLAYRSMPRFRNGSFRSWLFGITVDACWDKLRRRKWRRVLPIQSENRLDEILLSLRDRLSPHIMPVQLYTRNELEHSIQPALNLLDPDQRAVVVLVDLQDMDYQEAAQVLRISIGTAKSRLARGRERLRQILIHHEA
jgi:RNA polymerase sigma-70 factor (ECF subfamily)